jgi:hypothetical protein
VALAAAGLAAAGGAALAARVAWVLAAFLSANADQASVLAAFLEAAASLFSCQNRTRVSSDCRPGSLPIVFRSFSLSHCSHHSRFALQKAMILAGSEPLSSAAGTAGRLTAPSSSSLSLLDDELLFATAAGAAAGGAARAAAAGFAPGSSSLSLSLPEESLLPPLSLLLLPLPPDAAAGAAAGAVDAGSTLAGELLLPPPVSKPALRPGRPFWVTQKLRRVASS